MTASKIPTPSDAAVVLPRIESRILVVRGHKVIIDADLAALYDVPTKRLNEQVKRNAERFPYDFMFQLSAAEKAEVVANCDHLAKLKFSKALPYAFTEHGAIQAANVLASPRAVEMGIYVVRAFVRLKQASASYAELAKRLAELEEKTEGLAMNHDTFSRNTRNQLKQVFDALRELMTPPDPPKRPIGFINPEDKGSKKASGTRSKTQS
ncbi:MAG: ORF6N domain-containing protein [Burkholderiales bacterium]